MSDNSSEDLVTDAPEGEEVGDISSGHGNPAAPAHISDEKAEQLLTHRQQHEAPEGKGAGSW